MADEHALGIDLRFAVQSSTVIVVPKNEKLPSRYMYLQMAGRSQRDTDYPLCTLFSANGKGTGISVKTHLDTVDQNPLKDWDRVWDTVTGERKKEIGKAIKAKQGRNSEYKFRFCEESLAFERQLKILTAKKSA